ncbi:MAG: ABC transporter ATP-binding protein [Cryomorphaceae bacterium]|jgi:ATP-binding cassette subfamily B protein|nr:ABC transporter ATP-binding protein [Cryomorphaceae bacterium]MBT4237434.1 ABC transporter ATP-binding protein [Cryomorphaceae bacterium]MBT4813006.1 ABC transporter ATP-binding protein [Cryomorphaceae bacterium]MBT6224822.1 ABC transporter ATP-binding protein [Cryomorphaceae bacterium]MBT7695671.1 ABC transporter ATP-binding protein [Cryomorphaceae bacterium]
MKELKRLNNFLLKYKGRLILGLIITVVSRVFSLVTPRLVGDSMTSIENYLNIQSVTPDELKEVLLMNIIFIIGASLISGFFTFLMRQTIINVSRFIEFDVKNQIFSHYQSLDQLFYKKNRTGDLMNRISEDVSKVRMYYGPVLMYGTNAIILFIVIISYMFSVAPKLTIYSLIPLPILSIFIYKISDLINKKSTKVQESLSDLSTYSQESFSGISVLKSFNIQDLIFNKFDKYAIESFKNNLSLAKIQAWFFPIILFLIGLSNLIVIFIGGKEYIDGNIEIGVVAEFIIYVNMLTWPVTLVGWVTSIIKQAEASQKRINEFLDSNTSLENGTLKMTKKQAKDIIFKNVSFEYDQTGIKIFNSFNLKIEEGKTIGIVGKVGSGKTSILDLICRIYDPSSGDVFIGDKNLKSLELNELRKNISYVTQNNFLFSESIQKNIEFGNPNATKEEVKQAAILAEIDSEILKFKKGYETILGERGVTLSGGQVQRLSIARSFIKDSEIYLFDDCFSSLDSDTEDRIIKNLNNNFKDKTLLIVSHRVSCVKNADRIIVLENGSIIQDGTHSDLINIKGFYKDLFSKQNTEINKEI